jgi:hypothetical protein
LNNNVLGGSEMVPYEFRCPFGLVFDENKLVCEWPWKVPNCNSPEHNKYSTNTYGNYDGVQGYVPQEGIISQNGFIEQAGYPGQGVAYVQDLYNNGNYNADRANNVYNGNIYNGTGGFDSALGIGAQYGEHNYNAGGASEVYVGDNGHVYNSANVGNQESNYNAAGATANGANYNGNSYITNGAVNPVIGYNGQAYYPVNNPQGRVIYENNYNSDNVAGTGVNYDANTYYNNGAGKPIINHNGQTYNPTIAVGTGPEYEHNYNKNGVTATGVNSDENTYNVNGAVNPVIGHNSQTYYPVNNPQGVEREQNYNAGDATGTGINYDSKTYSPNNDIKPVVVHVGQAINPAGAPDIGIDYNGHDYNSEINYGGNIYNTNGVIKPTIGQDRQTYIPIKIPQTGIENGYNYNTGSGIGTGDGSDSRNYNKNYASVAGKEYPEYNYNAANVPGTKVNYDANNFNSDEIGIANNGQSNNAFGSDGSGVQKSPDLNTYGYRVQLGYLPGEDVVDCDKKQQAELPIPEIRYDGHYLNPSGTGYNYGQQDEYPGKGYHYPVYNNPAIVYGPTNDHNNKGITKSDDCDDKSTTRINNDDKHKASTLYNNEGIKTTQFNSGGLVTTIGINNLNQNTHATSGFTNGPTNFDSGSISTTGYNTDNTNTYSKNAFTGFTAGATHGNTGHVATGYVPNTGYTLQKDLPTDQFSNSEITKINQGITNNFNAFDSTTRNDAYGGTNSIVNIGNTQYASTVGPTIYNSSYNTAAGFPTSTIIPFVPKQNTYNSESPEISTPINCKLIKIFI